MVTTKINNIWQEYQASGLHVFPVKDKRPTVSSWKVLPDTVYFSDSGALGCGSLSNGVEVLDFDVKNTSEDIMTQFFELGGKSLDDLYRKLIVQRTPSNGFHFIYRCGEVEGNQVLAKAENGKAIIETRGEGGYAVIAPTPGYKLLQGSYSEIPTITESERGFLFETARQLNKCFEEVEPPKSKAFVQSIGALPPWEDYNLRGDIHQLLSAHGWTHLKTVGENIHYCRPDKSGSTSATFHEAKRSFYVFTTSTVFDALKGYSPSAVYAYLEAGKDFVQAAKKLRSLGFGETEKLQRSTTITKNNNLFRLTKPTSMERPKKLCGKLWAQGENAVLFAEDGAGKSVFAVQIGCAIATGTQIPGFETEVEAQPVTLFDTELSDYQFNTRYPNGLPENFKRLTFAEDQQKALIDASIDFVVDQIEAAARSHNSKIIILDNLSALASMLDLVKTSDSIRLMGLLNDLKKKGFSVLVIDHCRKPMKESEFKPISKHDLQGSKMKTNLVDSVFSIGKSAQGDTIRYIKGLKIRSFEMAYTKDSVATMSIKSDPLSLQFLGIDPEWQHVKDRTSEMMQMASEGKTQAEIARAFNVSQQAVSKSLKNA